MSVKKAALHRIAIKPYNIKQLSALYRVSRPTMIRWLKRIGIRFPRRSRIFTPREVRYIFEQLGEP